MNVTPVNALSQWWSSISTAGQVFYGLAILASMVIVIMGIISVIGIELHSVDIDHPDDATDGNSLFSIKSIVGALFAFGWAGGACTDSGLSVGLSVIIAFVAGFAALLVVAGVLKATRHLRSDGSLRKECAVGKVATVYVTIPPSGKGSGQVTVPLDGRTVVMSALQTGDTPLASGDKVTVTELIDSSTVRVKPNA
jgi:membrane protein implicated in regulation of membrane protease activity